MNTQARGAIWRAIGFLGGWLILTGGGASHLPAGGVAIAAATWASLRLMPPANAGVCPLRFAAYVLRFLRQAVTAGADVAWRALDPRLPLRPGFAVYHPRLPPGSQRNTFCAVMSLLPGTLPSGLAADGGLLIHCIDLNQPVIDQLAAEEVRFVHMLGGGHD